MRPSGRAHDELRPLTLTRNYTMHAEGSVLVECGGTRVLCTASVSDRPPPWLRGTGKGWVTAEYGMLPRSTGERMVREAARGKQSGRTQEIQRLIGRSLRAVVDLEALGERSIVMDCDVLQADGGTRTASITGAYVALADCLNGLGAAAEMSQGSADNKGQNKGKAATKGATKASGRDPLHGQVAAVSVGIYNGEPILDLDYAEDSQAETDLNVVMNEAGGFVEVQGTAEGHAFRRNELESMLDLAHQGITHLLEAQRQALANG